MKEYKGYYIEKDLLGHNYYTVFFECDDVVFYTVKEAKDFIDEVTQEEKEG